MTQVLIAQSATEYSEDWDGDIFVLEEELANEDDSNTYEVLRTLYETDIEGVYSLPMYRILWTHLAANYPDHGSLLELVPLSKRLEKFFRLKEPELIVIARGVEQKYIPLIEDIAEDQNCQVQNRSEISLRSRVANLAENVWNIILQPGMLILNQILSLIIPNEDVTRKPIAIFPFPGRYDSVMPVARELAHSATCYVPHLGSDVFDWPDVDWDIPLRSYQEYSSVSVIWKELLTLFELAQTRKRDEFSQKLTQVINDEFDIQLPRTVRYTVGLVFGQNVRSILYYYWAIDFFSTNEVSAALVGGTSPRDLSILQAAEKCGKDTYYIHHSVVTGDDFLPQKGTVYFVPSKIGAGHIRDIYAGIDIPSLSVTGRPYFDERYTTDQFDTVAGSENQSDITVLIATQPYRDEVRSKFVREICRAAEKSTVISEIRIKIHPSESDSYYQDLISDIEVVGQVVSVAGPNLEKEISQSSLVVSINSNVGLESMIQGTPAICYNEWHPSIQDKPYTRSEEIPVFDDPLELTEFFVSLSSESIDELRRNQTRFAREQFLTDTPAARKIADEIRTQSLGETD